MNDGACCQKWQDSSNSQLRGLLDHPFEFLPLGESLDQGAGERGFCHGSGRGEHRTFHPLRGDGLEADLIVVTGAVKELYNVPGAESTDSTNMVTLLRIKPDPESLDRVGAYMKSRH